MKWVVSIWFVVGAASAFAQGTFQNLDFEEANPVPYGFPYPGAYMTAGSALPGWETSISTTSTPVVVLNGASGGGAEISIENNYPIQGNYSAFLFGGVFGNNLESVSISQTAIIPSGTESIQLLASYFGAPFSVTVGGTPIDMVQLDPLVHSLLWSGNIPASMAGQTETLSITEPPPNGTPPSGLELDNISFSPNPITVTPEPSPFLLTGIGGLAFGIYGGFQVRRKTAEAVLSGGDGLTPK